MDPRLGYAFQVAGSGVKPQRHLVFQTPRRRSCLPKVVLATSLGYYKTAAVYSLLGFGLMITKTRMFNNHPVMCLSTGCGFLGGGGGGGGAFGVADMHCSISGLLPKLFAT